jgi:HSP20 family protein
MIEGGVVMSRETTQKDRSTEQQNSPAQASRNSSPATNPDGQQRDRERSIATGREESGRGSSGTNMARQGGTSPASSTAGHPFMLMQRMAQDMDRLFEQLGFGRSGFSLTPSLGARLDEDLWSSRPAVVGTQQTLWSPQVELFQRGDKLVVRADLPGVKKEDLHVEVRNDVLTLSGERHDEQEEKGEGYYHSERSYGRYYREIPLPEGVDADQIHATFTDGVLEVTLPAPKQAERQAKRIEIR